jgi:uncharacterized protein (DUF433 family)
MPYDSAGRLTMLLEDYFDFLTPDDIRIKGHRIGIEYVLLDYLHRNLTAEQIAQRYPSLTLEEVYAAILYYLHNREIVEQYLNDHLEWVRRTRDEAKKNPSAVARRVLAIKEERGNYSDGRDAA